MLSFSNDEDIENINKISQVVDSTVELQLQIDYRHTKIKVFIKLNTKYIIRKNTYKEKQTYACIVAIRINSQTKTYTYENRELVFQYGRKN